MVPNDATDESHSCLGFFMLWCMPMIVIPLFVLTMVFVFRTLGIWLALPGSIAVLVFLAKTLMGPWTPRRVVLYVVVQMIMIPLLYFALFLGICGWNGGMKI